MFEDILEGCPFEKLIDIIQNCPKGALEKAISGLFIEHMAMFELLNEHGISESDINNYIFNNQNRLEEESLKSLGIELSAKILGQEG